MSLAAAEKTLLEVEETLKGVTKGDLAGASTKADLNKKISEVDKALAGMTKVEEELSAKTDPFAQYSKEAQSGRSAPSPAIASLERAEQELQNCLHSGCSGTDLREAIDVAVSLIASAQDTLASAPAATASRADPAAPAAGLVPLEKRNSQTGYPALQGTNGSDVNRDVQTTKVSGNIEPNTQRMLDLFDKIDRSGDGQISKTELKRRLRNDESLARLLHVKQQVSNKDGSKAEFDAVFDAIDTHHTHAITRDEWKAFVTRNTAPPDVAATNGSGDIGPNTQANTEPPEADGPVPPRSASMLGPTTDVLGGAGSRERTMGGRPAAAPPSAAATAEVSYTPRGSRVDSKAVLALCGQLPGSPSVRATQISLPAGKLGIEFTPSVPPGAAGPVVNFVMAESPLAGAVSKGEELVGLRLGNAPAESFTDGASACEWLKKNSSAPDGQRKMILRKQAAPTTADVQAMSTAQLQKEVASLEGEVNKLDEKKQGLSSELAKGKETGSYQSMYV